MAVVRSFIIVIAVIALAVIFWLFYQSAMSLYQKLPELNNAAAWTVYVVGKYIFYAGVTTSTAWLLLALFDRDYIVKKL